MTYAKLNECWLYYETMGAAENPALILIPGFASGAWIWFRQAAELSRNFRVVTFDPRGVANSRIADGVSISLEKIADDIKDLLDELKIEQANVLGASFGGFAAQEFALKYPERLKKLILVCTSFGGKNHVAPALEVLQAFAALENLNSAERIRKLMIPAFSHDFVAARREEIEFICRLREQNPVPETVYLAQLQAATKFDAEHRVSNITAQTLVLSGDADAVVPPQNSVNLARLIQNAELKFVENGTHLFFIERAEEFNRLVTEFLLKK